MAGTQKAYDQGADFKRLSEDLAAYARNLVLASLPGVKQDLPDHEVRALAQEAAEHDTAQLSRVFELLQLAQEDVAKAASPRHAVEVAVLRAVYLAPSGSLPELVAKVEAMAGKEAPRVTRTLQASALRATAKPENENENDSENENEHEHENRPLDLKGRFRQLIESVRAARKAGAAAALEHAVPIKIDRTGVQIGFRKGAGQAEIVREARPALEDAFEKALGFRAPLQIVEQDAQPDASVAQEKQQQRAAASGNRIALAREHPSVRAAVEVLGGEIEDVRDLGEE
jgi:DNA polymerase III gamma/tau subunit